MKINTSLLISGTVLVILSFLLNFAFFQSAKLQKPIMLKHFYYVPASQGGTIDLHYLTNRHDPIDIVWITLPGKDHEFFSREPQPRQKYSHYQIKTFILEVDERLLSSFKEESPYLFKQVNAHLSNGDIVTLDVGEITLYDWNESTLQFQSSGSSSDQTGFHLLKADKDIEITSLEIPYEEELKNALALKLNSNQVELQQFMNESVPDIIGNSGEDASNNLFPLGLKKDELLSIRYQFSFPPNDPDRYHFYHIQGSLNGKESGGKTFTDTFSLSYQPYLDENDLKSIIREDQND